MIVVGVKVFLVIFYVISRIKFGETSHSAFCITVDGHSAGSQNFCSRCKQNETGGIGVYYTPDIYSAIFAGNYKKTDDNVSVSVTTITVDGVELEGWFHINLTMPRQRPVYAFVVQVEDDVTNRATGEFTTDLLDACEGRNLTTVPTASQILPCHSTPLSAVTVPNVFVYSRDADWKDGIIRSEKPPSEFHINWKIPPSYACASARTFHIRVRLTTLNASLSISETSKQCSVKGDKSCIIPIIHGVQKIKIHLPPFSAHGEFSYAHPLPPFYGKVECHNEMKMGPPTPGSEWCEPYLTNPSIPNTTNDWGSGSPCQQGSEVFPPGENVKLTEPLQQPPRPLYLGRCTEVKAGEAGANYSLACVGPSDPDDVTFVTALPTMTDYIEKVRYDLCRCESVGLTGGLTDDGGGLPLSPGSGPDIAPPPPLPPDYPDLDSGSINTLGVSDSNSTRTVETPLRKIQRKVNTMHFLHAFFSSIVFLFLIPVSIFSARYLKETFYRSQAYVDIWFRLHLFGVVGTFVCLLIGLLVLLAGNFWSGLLKPLDTNAGAHGGIGWVVIVLFFLLVVTGGLRPYNERSTGSLKMAIYTHALLGYVFYYLGLVALMLASVGSWISTLGISVIVVWIVIDILFHIVMTLHVMQHDRVSKLARSKFPVMELVYDRQSAPGQPIRKKLFVLYIVLSLIVTGLLCYDSHVTLHSEDSPFNSNRTLLLQRGSKSGIRNYY